MIDKNIPPPEKRDYTFRMTAEMKSMEPGCSVLGDAKLAHTIKSYGQYHGWETCQRTQPNGKIRIWRLK